MSILAITTVSTVVCFRLTYVVFPHGRGLYQVYNTHVVMPGNKETDKMLP